MSGPEPAPPAVSVVILAYQSAGTLRACLEALAAQSFTDFETLLADNASPDGAPPVMAAEFPQVRLIALGSNLGFAEGNNRAVQAARGRWIAFLNPDAYPEPGWLAAFVAATAHWPQVRCFTARQRMAGDLSRLDGLGDVMSATGIPWRGGYGMRDPGPVADGEVFSACGAAMLIERSLFLELGGFEARFFCYCEDVDLGYRLRLRGERVRLVDGAVVRHEGSASTGGGRSDFATFHGTRNRIWTFIQDTPPLLLWISAPVFAALNLYLLLRRREAAAFSGVRAALAGLGETLRRRRQIQAARTVGSLAILKAMSLNPLDLRRRAPVIKPPRGRL